MRRADKPRAAKAKPPRLPDKRVADLLAMIDERRGRVSIEKVCEQARIAPATFYSWRKGETAPDFSRLADLAEVLGIRLGAVLDQSSGSGGLPMASREARMVVQLMARLEPQHRQAVVDWVLNFVETHTSGSRPPPGPSQSGKLGPE
jgi:transcriptional regulator with XRE-family HTH domain